MNWVVQISLALKHVHDRKGIHKDIKPGNIFLTNGGMIKLGDFGVSGLLSGTKESSEGMTGTRPYMSPEMFESKSTHKTDVWSLGVILYQLCTFKLPFIDQNP